LMEVYFQPFIKFSLGLSKGFSEFHYRSLFSF
jgi:hypothetical protein